MRRFDLSAVVQLFERRVEFNENKCNEMHKAMQININKQTDERKLFASIRMPNRIAIFDSRFSILEQPFDREQCSASYHLIAVGSIKKSELGKRNKMFRKALVW